MRYPSTYMCFIQKQGARHALFETMKYIGLLSTHVVFDAGIQKFYEKIKTKNRRLLREVRNASKLNIVMENVRDVKLLEMQEEGRY